MELVKLLIVVSSVICVHKVLSQDDEDFGDDPSFGNSVTQELTNAKNYYTTVVKVKNTAKKYTSFNLKLSLDSSDFWIVRTDCKTNSTLKDCVDGEKTNGLNNKNIPVSKDVYARLNGISGLFAKPVLVALNDTSLSNKTVNTVDFGAISKFGEKFKFPAIGQFGLGFPNNSSKKTHFINTLKQNYALTELSVTIALDLKDNKDSITFGGVDPACDSNNIATFDIANKDKPEWAFKVTNASTQANRTTELKTIKDANVLARLDLDLPYILVPDCAYNQLSKRFKVEESFDCKDERNSFTLEFKVGKTSFKIESKSFVESVSSGQCKYALKKGETGSKAIWIFGTPFYKAFCVKHDYDKKQISLYKKET